MEVCRPLKQVQLRSRHSGAHYKQRSQGHHLRIRIKFRQTL